MTTMKKKYAKPSMMVYRLKTHSPLLQMSLPQGDPTDPTDQQW